MQQSKRSLLAFVSFVVALIVLSTLLLVWMHRADYKRSALAMSEDRKRKLQLVHQHFQPAITQHGLRFPKLKSKDELYEFYYDFLFADTPYARPQTKPHKGLSKDFRTSPVFEDQARKDEMERVQKEELERTKKNKLFEETKTINPTRRSSEPQKKSLDSILHEQPSEDLTTFLYNQFSVLAEGFEKDTSSSLEQVLETLVQKELHKPHIVITMESGPATIPASSVKIEEIHE